MAHPDSAYSAAAAAAGDAAFADLTPRPCRPAAAELLFKVQKMNINFGRNLPCLAVLCVVSVGPVCFLFSHNTRILVVERQVGRVAVEVSPPSVHIAESAGRVLSGKSEAYGFR